jgi:hypothetical protein
MTQEQREAMDRLHMYKTSSKYTEKCEMYGLNGDALCNAVDADRELLAEAFIAEHMADVAITDTERLQVIKASDSFLIYKSGDGKWYTRHRQLIPFGGNTPEQAIDEFVKWHRQQPK